jgi:hypothetical protein
VPEYFEGSWVCSSSTFTIMRTTSMARRLYIFSGLVLVLLLDVVVEDIFRTDLEQLAGEVASNCVDALVVVVRKSEGCGVIVSRVGGSCRRKWEEFITKGRPSNTMPALRGMPDALANTPGHQIGHASVLARV